MANDNRETNHLPFFHVWNLAIAGTVLCLAAGCANPPTFKTWGKVNTSETDVKQAMHECGYPSSDGTDRTTSRNEAVKMFQCMRQKGFQKSPPYDICAIRQELPACVAEKQGYPVSIAQLVTFPVDDDSGFWLMRPGLNLSPERLVGWRIPQGARNADEGLKNDRLALAAMYECGYPNPLGSSIKTITIGEAVPVQQCMLRKGFIPTINHASTTMTIPVCRQYPELPDCR
ncbi:hypothetical protein [Collimonas fungivorans]|uniref:hypothetical protein n=1 Tax=Collimonas fungivorans TaxID=158899 RepID=UPI000A5535E3|nr:hypothetical protein [Collimonas fungivorans]